MILLFGGEKGGSGKSTLATNAAVYLQREGASVILIDTDRQLTAANWAEVREESEAPSLTCVSVLTNVAATIRKLSADYDHAVIDAGGRDSEQLRAAMVVADRMVTPVKPSQADLWTLDTMTELVAMARGFNEGLDARVVLTMASPHPKAVETEPVRAALAELETFTACEATIHHRKAYPNALALGLSVIEVGGEAAAKVETESLMKELIA